MLVDTGDLETDRYLAGYYKIRLNAKEEIIYRVQAGADASVLILAMIYELVCPTDKD